MLAKLAAGAVGVAGDVPYREGPLLVFGLIGCAVLWDQGLSHSHRPYPITYGVGAYSNPHNGAYGYVRGAYGPYGGVAGGAWYNPSTGTGGRAVGACGPYGCAGAARAYNPYTGAYGATAKDQMPIASGAVPWGPKVISGRRPRITRIRAARSPARAPPKAVVWSQAVAKTAADRRPERRR